VRFQIEGKDEASVESPPKANAWRVYHKSLLQAGPFINNANGPVMLRNESAETPSQHIFPEAPASHQLPFHNMHPSAPYGFPQHFPMMPYYHMPPPFGANYSQLAPVHSMHPSQPSPFPPGAHSPLEPSGTPSKSSLTSQLDYSKGNPTPKIIHFIMGLSETSEGTTRQISKYKDSFKAGGYYYVDELYDLPKDDAAWKEVAPGDYKYLRAQAKITIEKIIDQQKNGAAA
jgi:hypothetical protein